SYAHRGWGRDLLGGVCSYADRGEHVLQWASEHTSCSRTGFGTVGCCLRPAHLGTPEYRQMVPGRGVEDHAATPQHELPTRKATWLFRCEEMVRSQDEPL